MPADARIVPFRGSTARPVEPALVVEGLRLSRREAILLDHVDLTLPGRGITALIGPNGAGKSLLLRTIAGLLPPDRGRLTFAEGTAPPALVFQTPVLLRRSVSGNLRHALRLSRVPRRDRPGRLAELLVLSGLSAQATAPARDLSGGEQQRLAVARALAPRPRLVLMDEPTASLDPAATAAIESLARRLSAEGVKIVFVTHDRAQAARLADDVAFLHKGRISEHRKAADFFARPRSEAAQAYLDGRLLI